MTESCPHGMPSRPSCVECMAEGPVAPPRREERPTVFTHGFPAKLRGTCSECNLEIHEGQRIVGREWPDGRREYVHARCALPVPIDR